MELGLMFLSGMLVGIFFTTVTRLHLLFRRKSKSSGTLRVKMSDDPAEPPYLFLELRESPYAIASNKQVTLDVGYFDHDSHK